MKNKKVLAVLMAAAMALSMPVNALASQSGSLDTDLETQKAVIRVQVPTSMKVSIDQFEIATEGEQIYSADFTMTNYSQMPVNVAVESTATLNTGVTLATTTAEVSTTAGAEKAWLAAAAAVAAGDYNAADNKATKDLTDADTNVTTFTQDGTSAKAKQDFYLSAAASNTASYAIAIPTKDDEAIVGSTTYYTATNLSPSAASDVTTAVATKDVIVYNATTETATTIAKGSTYDEGTFDASTYTYYTVGASVEVGDLAASTPYIYETAAEGGKAQFRYIGKLGSGTTGTKNWSTTDISAISIAYTITGITATAYTEVSSSLVYGYKAPAPANVAPSIATTTATFSKQSPADVVINYSKGIGDDAATDVTHVYIVNGDNNQEMVANWSDYISITDTTITIEKEWLAAYNANTTTNVYICFDMTDPTTEREDWATPDVAISIVE